MKLNPYIEILAKRLYNKSLEPVPFAAEDESLVRDAVSFVNCRTYVFKFHIDNGQIVGELL